MNIQLLRRIQKVIVKRAKQFNMDTWFSLMERQSRGVHCGTTACLAGWALTVASQAKRKKLFQPLLAAKSVDKNFGDIKLMLGGNENHLMCKKGAEVLELNEDQAEKLFYLPNWPQDLHDRYDAARRTQSYNEQAAIASERIDRFIASNGTI